MNGRGANHDCWVDRLYNGCEGGEFISVCELRTLASKWLLLWSEVVHIVEEQALTIYQVEALTSLFAIHSLVHKFLQHTISDAATSSSCTKAEIYLVDEFLARNVEATEDACKGNNTSALDVVVEDRVGVLVAVQDCCSVRAAEVLEVQVEVREELLDGGYKVVNECVIAVFINALVALAQVQWVIKEFLAVGASINNNRHNAIRVNTSCGGVNHKFTNGNFDAVGSPVANTQDCFCIGDDNQVDVSTCGCVLQRGFKVLRMIN